MVKKRQVNYSLPLMCTLKKEQILLFFKYHVVKTPRSVYTATPGRQACRPSQKTPIANFYLAGDYTMQQYLGSMEGAVLSGKLAASVIGKDYPAASTNNSTSVEPETTMVSG